MFIIQYYFNNKIIYVLFSEILLICQWVNENTTLAGAIIIIRAVTQYIIHYTQ